MSILAVCIEDAEMWYSEIPIAFWEEKLERLCADDHKGFVNTFNALIENGEVELKQEKLFSKVPAEVMARVKHVVFVSTWIYPEWY